MWHTKSHHNHGQRANFPSGNSKEYRQRAKFIPDNFSSLDQVISALRESGLESSNLILGIDFTKSNEWTVCKLYRDHVVKHGNIKEGIIFCTRSTYGNSHSIYKATQHLRPMENQQEKLDAPKILPPPSAVIEHDNARNSYPPPETSQSTVYNAPVEQACPICLTNPKDMAFGCGHLTCKDCGATLSTCPLCRAPISTHLRLYG